MLKSILSKIRKFQRQIGEARSFGKKTSFARIFSLGMLGFQRGFGPLEYFLYGFDGEDVDRRFQLSYLSNEQIVRKLRPRLNNKNWIPILENKLLFYLYYSKCALPVVKVFGFYHPKGGFSLDGALLNGAEDIKEWVRKSGFKSLVVKPVGSLGGKGIMIFDEFVAADRLKGNDGNTYRFSDVVAFMDSDIAKRQQREDPYSGYIIEEKILQDPVMSVLSGCCLNSVRVSTLVTNKGEILLDFAMLRVGKEGSLTDNLHQGGYVVNIDLKGGSLDDRTFGYRGKEGPWVEEKPVKVRELFAEGRVPHWDAITNLALRAAKISPELRTVGWDIALSTNGPVLMEGNDNWDMVIAQVLAGGYLTPERRAILKEYGMEFPA